MIFSPPARARTERWSAGIATFETHPILRDSADVADVFRCHFLIALDHGMLVDSTSREAEHSVQPSRDGHSVRFFSSPRRDAGYTRSFRLSGVVSNRAVK